MYFKVANGTVTITDKDGNVTTYNDFTMDTENGVIVLKLKNHPGQELPNTGGEGTLLFSVVGTIFLLTATLGLMAKKKRETSYSAAYTPKH